jgi:hypothetical protein
LSILSISLLCLDLFVAFVSIVILALSDIARQVAFWMYYPLQ